ncbi:MAG: bifunctional DNA-formamidopyrimidine glycosylase/DNA-(apurinic or apyrimidinic site) lyase [Alphaproteobacteria bacterium]|nr:bifunctional DNA-formamidopyrimidine glycosylase/DNA-(apurinic or apyrimidinic site) lyase [Alphaproteobacteria bacterium]
MPELPEVETVRLGLVPVLEGRKLVRVEARRPDLRIAFPPRFAERLTGRRVEKLTRRAKYILAELDDGEILLMHLGMSGRFFVDHERTNSIGGGAHDHVLFETDRGARVIYSDHRRFGLMTLIAPDALAGHKLLKGLGPEPLSADFSAAYLSDELKGKKTPIKAALLDQRVVAGLGNIYVCEALYRAHISPKRLARSLKREQIARLVTSARTVLEDAIRAGGSTLRDYRRADGELGYFQHRFRVYDREGQACLTRGCRGHVKRIVQSGRSTFYCPVCQR